MRLIARQYFTPFLLRHVARFPLWGDATILRRRCFATRGLLALHRFALLDRAALRQVDARLARGIVTISLDRLGIGADRGRPALLGCADRAGRCIAFHGGARRHLTARLFVATHGRPRLAGGGIALDALVAWRTDRFRRLGITVALDSAIRRCPFALIVIARRRTRSRLSLDT